MVNTQNLSYVTMMITTHSEYNHTVMFISVKYNYIYMSTLYIVPPEHKSACSYTASVPPEHKFACSYTASVPPEHKSACKATLLQFLLNTSLHIGMYTAFNSSLNTS